MFKAGMMVVDESGRRGKVVGADSVVDTVMLVIYDGDAVASPVHQARLSLLEPKRAEAGGQRVIMVKGAYEGAEGWAGEPRLGPGSPVPVQLDNGVVGEWSPDYFKAVQRKAASLIQRVAVPGTVLRKGVLDVTAQEEELPELVTEPAEDAMPSVADQPDQPAPKTEGNERVIKENAVLALDKELRSMFGSTVVPQITVKGIEPLQDGGYAIVMVFSDTLGKHTVEGTAVATGDTLFPPDKLFAAGKEVGTFAQMPALFRELPESESGLVQELETAEGPKIGEILGLIQQRFGVLAYQRAFDKYRFKATDAEVDKVHTLMEVGGAQILKAVLIARGCEACGGFKAASLHNFQPLCGPCRKPVYEVTVAECEVAVGQMETP